MYRSTIHHKIAFETNEYSFILVTILKMSAVCTGPLKQNQRLASRPQADAVAKSLCKGGSWVSERLYALCKQSPVVASENSRVLVVVKGAASSFEVESDGSRTSLFCA
jgi:hypothetical protein